MKYILREEIIIIFSKKSQISNLEKLKLGENLSKNLDGKFVKISKYRY